MKITNLIKMFKLNYTEHIHYRILNKIIWQLDGNKVGYSPETTLQS